MSEHQEQEQQVCEVGDRVRVVSSGKHNNARGVVQSIDGEVVSVRLNRPKARVCVAEFGPAELERLP